MRSGQSLAVLTRALITPSMESSRGATRYLSAGKGKILSEEERAAEHVYIQMNERELLALGFYVNLTDDLKGKSGTEVYSEKSAFFLKARSFVLLQSVEYPWESALFINLCRLYDGLTILLEY